MKRNLIKRSLIKRFLPVAISCVLITGCSANTNQISDTATNSSTKENAISTENTKEDAEGQKERKDNSESQERQGGQGNDAVRADNGGRMGQKAVLTEDQQKLIDATKDKFKQYTYEDAENNTSLDYSLFIPANYDEAKSYPLIMFIPDSSATGKSSEEILSQYYGADIWASDSEQAKHASFVFCPAFFETVVNDNYSTSDQIDTAVKILNELIETYNIDISRIYTTGQSMGCMTSLYLNSIYPDLFAASLFVSGQWDITTLKPLENKKFFYITCSGDQKASGGQTEVMDMFEQDGISYSFINNMDPEADIDEKNKEITAMLKNENEANFVRFDGLDHMSSFNYAYELESVRDWLFSQSK